jgi:hypothetical protein
MRLPLRYRILHLTSKKEVVSDVDMLAILKKEYPGEGQVSLGMLRMHMHSMRANGLVENAGCDLDKQGNLIEKFTITPHGHVRLKMLPKSWNESMQKQ